MADQNSTLSNLMTTLKRERDELKLKIHLAEMEAKEEYERLSGKYDELAQQYAPVTDAASETADNVVAALSLAAGEMKNGFQRIRKALSDKG